MAAWASSTSTVAIGGSAAGSWSLRRQRRPASGPELTPLVDVVFQLLVFFLLSSVFAQPAIPLELPESTTAEQTEQHDPVIISMTATGELYVGDTAVPVVALAEHLGNLQMMRRAATTASQTGSGAKAPAAPAKPLQIAVQGDVAARYGLLMKVMDACRTVGITSVGLVSDVAAEPGASR